MKQFAIIESGYVTNIIVAESQSIAESITKQSCIEIIENNNISIGDTYDGKIFWTSKPYPSWIKGEDKWEAPIPYPTDLKQYIWNESELSWEEIVLE